jgi:hypothetical protein
MPGLFSLSSDGKLSIDLLSGKNTRLTACVPVSAAPLNVIRLDRDMRAKPRCGIRARPEETACHRAISPYNCANNQ